MEVLAVFLILFMFDRLRNKFMFLAGLSMTRAVIRLCALFAVIAAITAFLSFLAITNAFKTDLPSCTSGPCNKFMDSVHSGPDANGITTNEEWGPATAWSMLFASIPVSVLNFIVIVSTKFPLPVDSEATSGEA